MLSIAFLDNVGFFILFIFCFLGTLCLFFFSLGCRLTVIWFFFFFVKLDVIFFSWHDYYFLINLGDFFFLCLSNFCFDWTSFFNKCMWVNLCKLFFFFHPSTFSLSIKQRGEKLKYFLSSHFSINPSFSTLLLFHHFDQIDP